MSTEMRGELTRFREQWVLQTLWSMHVMGPAGIKLMVSSLPSDELEYAVFNVTIFTR
jgi:hypothetical protein